MKCLKIFELIIVIKYITCGILSENLEKTPLGKYKLQRKQVKQIDKVLDLRYLARNSKPGRFHFRDTLFYDPVFENHSVLADFLNKNEEGATSEMKMNRSSPQQEMPKKVKCTGLCETSICPWTVEIDTNGNRIPENIAYASCKSGYCDVEFTGMSPLAKLKMEMDTYCETLHTDIYATINGKDEWLKDWPIACLCVRAYTKNHLFGTSLKRKPSEEREKLKAQHLANDRSLELEAREEALNLKTIKKQNANTLEKTTKETMMSLKVTFVPERNCVKFTPGKNC